MAGKGSPKGVKQGGRAKGTTNKVTKEFRETIRDLLDENAGNVSRWLSLVAEGDGTDKGQPDPARALDILAKLAEFAAPKLNRTEHVGANGGPIQKVTRIELVDMDDDSAD